MVLTPGFYNETQQPRNRPRSRRERWVIGIGATLTALVVAVTLFSLTSHSDANGNGCLNFTYAMVMGGEQFHACGDDAKNICAKPPSLGGLANGFAGRLRDACNDAGLRYRSGIPAHA